MESGDSKFIVGQYVTFSKIRKGRKSKDLKVKKTHFEVEVIIRETRDEKEVKPLDYSSNEENFSVALNYHLVCDIVRRKTVPY